MAGVDVLPVVTLQTRTATVSMSECEVTPDLAEVAEVKSGIP